MGYTNQFCVPEETSVFFSSCDSVVGDFLEFNHESPAFVVRTRTLKPKTDE